LEFLIFDVVNAEDASALRSCVCFYRVHCQLLQVFTRRSQEIN